MKITLILYVAVMENLRLTDTFRSGAEFDSEKDIYI